MTGVCKIFKMVEKLKDLFYQSCYNKHIYQFFIHKTHIALSGSIIIICDDQTL